MRKLLTALFLSLFLFPTTLQAGDVWVNGYTKKNGTNVSGYYRSRPNAYKWDNKSYTPSQPAYNKSYSQPTKNYNSNWYTPSETRFQDSNPYNDTPPTYNSSTLDSYNSNSYDSFNSYNLNFGD